MLAFERQELIVNEITHKKKILVVDLSKKFDVSEETIRRDLSKLEEAGVLVRTHGGAVLNEQTQIDLPYITRNTINRDLKLDIAQKVLDLIPENSTIMCDTSSTVFEAIHTLQERNNLTVITNSLDILQSLMTSNLELISTGGYLRKQSECLVGEVTRHTVQSYHADFGIFSCKSLSKTKGVMDTNEHEAGIKRLMANNVNKTILLIDSTKFDTNSFINVFPLEQIDCIVTNEKPSSEWIEIFIEKNIKLVY